jgi:hypothetical protein
MKLTSPEAQGVLEKLMKLSPPHKVTVVSAIYDPKMMDGVSKTTFCVDDVSIVVESVVAIGELTVGIKSALQKTNYGLPFLETYLDRHNRYEDLFNRPRLIDWLVENFDRVRRFLTDPSAAIERAEYEAWEQMMVMDNFVQGTTRSTKSAKPG